MTVKKTELTEDILNCLISLSIQWEQENICFGYRRNTIEDIKGEDIFLAEEDGTVLGFLLCHTYVQEKDLCTVPAGSKCLEIEELYVVPEHRSKGIGRKLYQKAVNHYHQDIQFVTLGTATKNYKAILRFYVEELGMEFWSARLFQHINQEQEKEHD